MVFPLDRRRHLNTYRAEVVAPGYPVAWIDTGQGRLTALTGFQTAR